MVALSNSVGCDWCCSLFVMVVMLQQCCDGVFLLQQTLVNSSTPAEHRHLIRPLRTRASGQRSRRYDGQVGHCCGDVCRFSTKERSVNIRERSLSHDCWDEPKEVLLTIELIKTHRVIELQLYEPTVRLVMHFMGSILDYRGKDRFWRFASQAASFNCQVNFISLPVAKMMNAILSQHTAISQFSQALLY